MIRKILLIALLVRLVLIFTPPHVDLQNHIDWGLRFWRYGPKDFYEQIFWGVSWPNQPVGSILLFAFIAKLNQWLFQFFWWLNLTVPLFPSPLVIFLGKNLHWLLLKLPFVLADLAMGYLLYRLVADLSKKEKPALVSAALFLFNPALIYNSTVWGQTDSLVNLLALAGLWLVYKNHFFMGVASFFLSLYVKLSLVIFLPLLLLLFWWKREKLLAIVVSTILGLTIFLTISLPFVHHGNVISWLAYLYTNPILSQQGEMLSGNAFNFWSLIAGIDLSLKETMIVAGLPAKLIGQGLFAIIAGLFTVLLFIKRKRPSFIFIVSFGIILSFAAFLFLTNMHERYLYPVFPLLAIIISLTGRRRWPVSLYLALSAVYLLNLYNLWWFPLIPFLVAFLTANGFLVPRIFSLVNICLFLLVMRILVVDEREIP